MRNELPPLRRILLAVGCDYCAADCVVGVMKQFDDGNKMKTELEVRMLLEEQLASTQRDVGLILDDVKNKDLLGAINGIDTVVRDLSEMRQDILKALHAHEKLTRAN